MKTFYQLLLCVLFASAAHAQSNQYSRAKKSAAPAASPAADAQKGEKPADGEAAAQDPNKKVDISDLEQKYWAPKDTEFSVVQNRTYTKANRFAATLSFGTLINDQYSKASASSLAVNYYISERMGFELSYLNMPSVDNKMTAQFIGDYGTSPDHNKPRKYVGLNFNWIPIYAKISLLEKQIIYFDMSISPGVGVVTYDHVRKGSNVDPVTFEEGSSPAFSLDIAQHFFINKNFALRFDLKNHFFYEKVQAARPPFEEKETRGTSNTLMLFGVTYYH